MDELKLMGVFSLILVALVAVGAILTAQVIRPLIKNECRIFSQESGREVKFVDYNWVSYDCLTKQKNGKWISTNNLREEN